MLIRTKYLAPTDHRGARVKASSLTGRVSVTAPWEHSASVETNHKLAAFDLAQKLELPGLWSGVADDGGGYVFLHEDAPSSFTVVL